MKFKMTIDWTSWLIGFARSPVAYTSIICFGPINVWVYHEKRMIKDLAKKIEEEEMMG